MNSTSTQLYYYRSISAMRIITIHSMCDENHKLFRREQIVHAKDSKVRQIKLNCSLLYTIYVHLNAHSQNLYRFDSISSIDLRISFPFCYFRFLCAKIARKKICIHSKFMSECEWNLFSSPCACSFSVSDYFDFDTAFSLFAAHVAGAERKLLQTVFVVLVPVY